MIHLLSTLVLQDSRLFIYFIFILLYLLILETVLLKKYNIISLVFTIIIMIVLLDLTITKININIKSIFLDFFSLSFIIYIKLLFIVVLNYLFTIALIKNFYEKHQLIHSKNILINIKKLLNIIKRYNKKKVIVLILFSIVILLIAIIIKYLSKYGLNKILFDEVTFLSLLLSRLLSLPCCAYIFNIFMKKLINKGVKNKEWKFLNYTVVKSTNLYIICFITLVTYIQFYFFDFSSF